MATTPKYLLTAVHSIDEIREFHHQTTQPRQRLAGLEEEIFIHSAQQYGLPLAVHEQNINLEKDLLNTHPRMDAEGVSLEPGAHMIETKTTAFPREMQNCTVLQAQLRRSAILQNCTRNGLIRSPYSSLPHISPNQALRNIIRRVLENPERGDRQITLMDVFRRRVTGASHYPVYSVGEQYTHGVTDVNELLETKRVLYTLAALIYNIFDNSPPFIGNERQTVHPVIDLRLRLGSVGLIDQTVFDAENGNDYVERKITETLDKPLFVTHDVFGRYEPQQEATSTFRDHLEQGKATKLLYLIAQLQGWPFLKDKLFHNEADGFYAIGNEIRDLGNGLAGPSMAVALFTPIAFDSKFRHVLMEVLESKYGLPLFSNPAAAYETVEANLHATHQRKVIETADPSLFLNAPFGANGHSQLQFMREDLIPMLKDVHRGTRLAETVGPLAFIAETGLTDTQFFHYTQTCLQDTLDFMNPEKGYDHGIYQSSSRTIAQLYLDGELPQVRNENTREINALTGKEPEPRRVTAAPAGGSPPMPQPGN